MSSFLKKRASLLAFCTINSIFLVVITIAYINHSFFLSDDEEYLIKGTAITNNFIFKSKDKPDSTAYLFINLSWEKQLIDVKNETGQVIGKRAITNRERIAKFFEYLNKNPEHKFIILDVWFKDSSDYKTDSLLQAQFNQTKNFLIPYHKDPNNDLIKDTAIFKASTALSDYEKDDMDNNFVKFRLVQGDGFKTTPLVAYEKLHKKEFKTDGFWYYLDDHLALNSFILELRIWNGELDAKDLEKNKTGARYNKSQLAEFLDIEIPGLDSLPAPIRQTMNDNLRANIIHDVTKDKIIVIGDFEDSDIHETIYGATAGPLILLNILLALEAGDNLINWGFVLFLFIGYFIVSYKCYTRVDILDRYLIGRLLPRTNFRTYIMSFMSYLIYFILLSLISYFLFNVHLTILLLAFYMEMLEWIVGAIKKRRNKEIPNTVTPAPIPS